MFALIILLSAAVEVDDNCTHGTLQVASSTDDSDDLYSEGRLEVCVNGAWGTICDTAYGTRDAQVACRQLGYDDHGIYFAYTCISLCAIIYYYYVTVSLGL